MRTVLVCVRTPLAAQNIAVAAARLGLAAAVRTAVSDPEVMLRLTEQSADVVLADTGLTRPDTVGFTRRVLSRSPGATILLIGTEEPGVAAAAIAAGARGLIHGGDMTSAIAKAILLLASPRRVHRGGPGSGGLSGGGGPGSGGLSGGGVGPQPASSPSGAPEGAEQPTVVPVQRAEDGVAGEPPAQPHDPQPRTPTRPQPAGGPAIYSGAPDPRANAATEARFGPPRRGEPANPGGYGRTAPGSGERANPAGYGRAAPGTGGPVRRITLTEREMQVLVGMADGKSNAEIGRELFVSEDTVKTHARRLFRKLGARDRAHAVAAGFRAGLVT